MDVRWKHPFNCIVSGPTKSGKTEFVKKLVLYSDELVSPRPEKIYWCYAEWQPAYAELLRKKPNIKFVEGLPDLDELKNSKNVPKLLILDDMMMETNDERFAQLFTKGSHHWSLSIVFIMQNAFYAKSRTLRINCEYLVLLKSVSDKLQVQTLGRQIFPGSKHFLEAYEDATGKPYGYLVIDLTPTTHDGYRLRTNIFPVDETHYVYTSK